MIPSAIQLFNKETCDKKENLRNFIGLKQPSYRDSSSGLYGVEFFSDKVDYSPVDKSDYVPCLEKGCSFKGPISMMELHHRTVHEMGLDKEINIDNETWIKNRKKNFPSLNKPKEAKINDEVSGKPQIIDKRSSKNNNNHHNNNRKRMSFQESAICDDNTPLSIGEDPLSIMLSKKLKEEQENTDILGLCASYPLSDEEESDSKQLPQSDVTYMGLPLPEELSQKQRQVRKNKFRFPILPQMELSEKRKALMNPQRRYLENHSRKVKRPRLAEIMCAEELSSERNIMLQCIRYLCNKRFLDPSLSNIVVMIGDEEKEGKKKNKNHKKMAVEEAEDEDIFKIEEAVSDDDGNELEEGEIWSDGDL